MKFMIIGLGSMGKRRVRCLHKLGYKDVLGFDPKEERRKEAEQKYGIRTIGSLDGFDFKNVDVLIASTPPNLHNQYIKLAIEKKKPIFVEASVILEGLEDLRRQAESAKVLVVPSSTMVFHPAIQKIHELVMSNKYGKATSFSFHSGQYLPDWHPWEKVKDYYVGKKETGGAREIVAYELSWLVSLFGFPTSVTGYYGKTMDVGADIDDTYVAAMRFKEAYGTMVIDVVSRYAIRSLLLNLEKAQIQWRWDIPHIRLYDSESKQWSDIAYSIEKTESEYNQNISEDMYVHELAAFIDQVNGKGKFPNTLEEDIRVLEIMHQIEGSQ